MIIIIYDYIFKNEIIMKDFEVWGLLVYIIWKNFFFDLILMLKIEVVLLVYMYFRIYLLYLEEIIRLNIFFLCIG